MRQKVSILDTVGSDNFFGTIQCTVVGLAISPTVSRQTKNRSSNN